MAGGQLHRLVFHTFQNRVKAIYASRSAKEQEMLSLDADAVLLNDESGLGVSLGERIADRSVDVLSIVLFRERVAEAALEQRQLRADRAKEFTTCIFQEPKSPTSSRSLFLVEPDERMTDVTETAEQPRPNRKVA